MKEEVSFTKFAVLSSLLNRNRRGFFWTSVLGLLLNSVIWNALMGARQVRVASGDFGRAANINALLEVTFQFNLIFAIIAAAITAMLLMTVLSARYSSRMNAVRILRLNGLSFRDLLVSHALEAFAFGVGASVIAMLLFSPVVWAYGQVLEIAGLVPEDVTIHGNFTAGLLVCVGLVVFIVGASVAKTLSVFERKKRSGSAKRGSKVLYLLGLFIVVMLGIPLMMPNSPIPGDTRIILIIPWACVVLLVYGVRMVQGISDFLQWPMRKTGKFPRLGLALSRLASSMSSRMNPVIPLTIVMAFMVPLSAVMATGRSASIVEIYDSVDAQTIATTRNIDDADELAAVSKDVSETVFVSTASDLYKKDDPYGAEQPIVGLLDLRRAKTAFPTINVVEGSIESVGSSQIATSDSRYNVGDKMSFYTANGRECVLYVAAVLDMPALLRFNVIGMPEDSPCGGMRLSQTTAYSQLGVDELEEHIKGTGWEVATKSEWINTGISQTEQNQRSALIVMFLIPVVIALFVTGTSVGSYRTLIQRSSVSLFYAGGAKRDFRIISLYEAMLGCAASLLLLFLVVGLSASILVPYAREAGTYPTLDYTVAGVFLFASLSVITIIYLASGDFAFRTARRWRGGETY